MEQAPLRCYTLIGFQISILNNSVFAPELVAQSWKESVLIMKIQMLITVTDQA